MGKLVMKMFLITLLVFSMYVPSGASAETDETNDDNGMTISK
ncbi:hypothetical protein [Jeotgalibacillus marinus]|uniref:Uncharacterized protein n=1 Tax=Jeotgalibacillus marinus TaxID=86667 RepID=A0ABV3PZ35_9BACL